ncbi:hypothetical protein F4778DRAFT_673199 [Xylariomycetidae sp. FL2044]|nr:hypothetical protein F4778DRAFT_673199 [Xylariomycetidae sp. FL2044]
MASNSAIPPYVAVPPVDYVKAELAVNCVVVALVLLVVGLRVFARVTGPGLGLDDAFAVFAAPLGVGMVICAGFLLPVGSGYSLPAHPELAGNPMFILMMSFIMEIIYVLCLASSKASMLFFYKRVFCTDLMQTMVNIALGVLVLWTIAFECACIFLCTPVNAFWLSDQSTCGKFVPMIQSLIATNAVGDLIILLMPMATIWSLQMRKTDKAGLMACFALGLACIVIAIFRVIYLAKVDLTADILGTMPTTVFLFALEPNLAVLCVSIPMLRTLYARYRTRSGTSRLTDGKSNSKSGSGGASNGIRTIGMISGNGQQARRGPKGQADLESQWEMDDYYDAKATKGRVENRTVVDAYTVNDHESGSEKSLATRGHVPAGGIEVETKWSVQRT